MLGISKATVIKYLYDGFKQKISTPPKTRQPRVSASQRIEMELGKDVVERYRNELLASPEFRREAILREQNPRPEEKAAESIQDTEMQANYRFYEGAVWEDDFKDNLNDDSETPVKRVTAPDQELIRKQNYLLRVRVIDGYIKRDELSCPKCGGKKLAWQCCGWDIADAETISRLREEVKAR